MGIDIGKAVGDALRSSLSLRKILPIFLLGVIAVILIFAIVMALFGSFQNFAAGTTAQKTTTAFLFLGFILFAFVVLVIVFLLSLFFEGALTDQARRWVAGKDAALSLSYPIAKRKYFSMLGATLLTVLIGFLVGIIPFVGFILSIVVSWFFLFLIPIIIVDDENATSSLEKGYRLFMNHKGHVILIWLVLIALTIVLGLLALIPFIIAALPLISAFVITAIQGGSFAGFGALVSQNLGALFIGAIVTVFLFSYVIVVSINATTFFYLQLKGSKKRSKN